jgi:pyridoxal phosphate enzyme (YggS family)
MGIAENLQHLRIRVAAAAERSGRDPAYVRIVGASAAFKGVTASQIGEALAAGLQDFGENRVQEASAHIDALGELAATARWHLIGRLQTNKAREAAMLFDTIETVDSLRLAERLSAFAPRTLRVMIEVNVSGEASKAGVPPGEVDGLVDAAARLPNLDLAGLMTVAPAVADPELVRHVFRELRELGEANGLQELSMGMTNDFEVAIEEGATIVRIGRALLGERSS